MDGMKTITVHLKDSNSSHFRFSGIASSESRDSYGEIIKQRGINLSLVEQGKVIVNAEHDNSIIGKIEYADIRYGELYVEGIVYLKTSKAKRFYNLLKKNNPKKPVTLSIEFVNPEYSVKDKSILSEIVLTAVALIGLRDEPANKDTYAELLKSVSKKDLFEEIMRRADKSNDFQKQIQRLLNKAKQL
jgi:hypothetical protein